MNKYQWIYRTNFQKRAHNRLIYLQLVKKYTGNDLDLALAMFTRKRNFIVNYGA